MPYDPTENFNRNLAYVLGYSARDFDPRYNPTPIVFPEFTENDQEYILGLLAKLDAINEELETNRKDSMALSVGDVKVDFHKNILITKQEGSRVLNELSAFTSLPLFYDRYLGKPKGQGYGKTAIAIENYG